MSGTKTALALAFASGAIMWIYHSSRSGTLATTLVRLLIAFSALALAVPGTLWVLSWASPSFFARVESILTNGIWAFPSMQGRGAIWNASLEIALANPWFGAGAGTEVLGYAHSHNMLLDYFRGMGISALLIGATLVLSALSRCAGFLLSTWRKREIDRASDTVIAGMYVGAIFHLMGNQLSDSFSPTTAFMFWIMYFGAYFTANAGARAPRPRRRPSTVGWLPRAQVSLAPAS
jgi:O-antigen ligase